MVQKNVRCILHVDMDAFFASVEEQRRPELRGKPLVIGGNGDPMKRGVVSTASYEARRFGIHSAMPLRVAWRLCPEAVFLPVDYREYARISEVIKGILREVSPVMEDVGIDEAFLDVSGIGRNPEELGREIKSRIWEKTGLTCSIGIAPNKLLAKMASDMDKPDGITILTGQDIAARIWPLPVRKLRGVGPKTEEHLKEIGVETVGDLAALPLETLIDRFGLSYGDYLFNACRGVDDTPLATSWEPKSMSRETTFQHDVGNRQALFKVLALLCRDVAEELTRDGYRGQTVTVKLRYGDFETHTHAKTLPNATCGEEEIRRAAFACFSLFELKKKVRLIGVRVSRLVKW
jgi:DNA polymerase-4